MSAIETSWAVPAVQAIAWALIHFLWQGALVGLAAAGVLGLLKRGSAASRYAVAAGALLLMLALPVGTALRMAGSPGTGRSSSGHLFLSTNLSLFSRRIGGEARRRGPG